MVKVAFTVMVFNDDYVLEPALRSVRPFGEIYVAEGPVRYWQDQGFTTSVDKTNEILDSMIPRNHIVRGWWPTKNEQCNAMLHLVPDDVDYIWEVDADEVWKPEDVGRILYLLEEHNPDSMSFKMKSFWAGTNRIIGGFESDFEVHRIKCWYPGARFSTHRPPSMWNSDGTNLWRGCDHWDHNRTSALGLYFYHYSYVFPSQVEKKEAFYLNYDAQSQIANWYEDVYLAWLLNPSGRRELENIYNGVHNWRPEIRGETYTEPFLGKHPVTIDVDAIVERIQAEL